MTSRECPDVIHLQAFSVGRLVSTEWNRIASHIQVCSACQATLDAMTDSSSSVARITFAAKQPQAYVDEPQCREAVQRIARANARQEGIEEPTERNHDRSAKSDIQLGGNASDERSPEEPAHLPVKLGDYQVESRIGHGGMGSVFQAVHVWLQKPCALKILPLDHRESSQAVQRFLREMKAVGRLEHPNLVRATDAGQADGIYFLVMELLPGMNLAELVKRLGPLPLSDTCDLIMQAACGLQYAHDQGLIHRDIKPSNLMLLPTGPVKILDLGLALLPECADGELSTWGQLMGTLQYMAPEQVSDSHHVDGRADLYALGATWYHLLTAQPPFPAQRPFQQISAQQRNLIPPIGDHRSDVPKELEFLLLQMLATNAAERPDNAAAVADRLAPFASQSDLPNLLRRAEQVTPRGRGTDADYTSEGLGGRGSRPAGEREPTSSREARSAEAPPASPSDGQQVRIEASESERSSRRTKGWSAVRKPLLLCLAVLVVGATALSLLHYGKASREGGSSRVNEAGVATELRNADQHHLAEQDPPEHRSDDQAVAEPGRAPQRAPEIGAAFQGMLPDPAPLSRGERWQVDTVFPRDAVLDVAWLDEGKQVACTTRLGQFRIYNFVDGQFHLDAMFSPSYDLGDWRRTKMNWSPDQTWVTLHHNDRHHKSLQFFTAQGSPGPVSEQFISTAGWSSDGRHVAIGTPTGLVVLLAADGTRHVFPQRHAGWVTAMAWSPDGQWLATAAQDSTLRLWHADGREGPVLSDRVDLTEHFSANPLAFSPDSRCIYAAMLDGTIHVWSVADQSQRVLEDHDRPVVEMAFSPDGRRLASRDDDRIDRVRLWNAETGELMVTLPGFVGAMQWSACGQWLATTDAGPSIRLWDAEGRPGPVLRCEAYIGPLEDVHACLAWSPDGKMLLSSGWKSRLRVWDVAARRGDHAFPNPSVAPIAAAWSPDGRQMAVAGGHSLHVLQGEDGEVLTTLEQPALVNDFAWHPEKSLLATAGDDGAIRIWQRDRAQPLQVVSAGVAPIRAVAWHPDGVLLASGHEDSAIRIWNVSSWNKPEATARSELVKDAQPFAPELTLYGHTDRVVALRWNEQGQLASVGRDRNLYVWTINAAADRILERAGVEPAVAWSPDGRYLAYGANEHMNVWDMDGDELLVEWPAKQLLELDWSPDGRSIAFSGYAYERIELFDVPERLTSRDASPPGRLAWEGEAAREGWAPADPTSIFSGHDFHSSVVAFAPDNRRLLSASLDHTLSVWDIQQRQPLWTAVLLPKEKLAVFDGSGELVYQHPGVEPFLVHLVKRADGIIELLGERP